MKIGGYYLYR